MSAASAPARYVDLLARLDTAAGALGVDLGLDRVRRALARLGDPQRRYPTVQIAGTNGKGSTAAMTQSILRRAGFRTGLYTSPHLARFTERVRVDAAEVDGDRLAALDLQVQAAGERLTYFEIATVLAFLAFAEAGVDVAVLETGLGGRLDAVTCCEPLATAITSIGLDHTDYLGPTLADIAREKAGILKPGIPCFVGGLPPEAESVIAERAAAVGAPLRRLGIDFSAPSERLGLAGPHQKDNAAIAVALGRAVAEALGRPPLDDAAIASALGEVRWPGRLEMVADDVWLDCAHNAEGARALAAALPAITAGRAVTLVMSVARDKDAAAMLAALAPVAGQLIATSNDSPRALPAGELAAQARGKFRQVAAVDDPWAALVQARTGTPNGVTPSGVTPDGVTIVCGSMFLVGPLRARLLGEPLDPRRTSDPLRGPTRP